MKSKAITAVGNSQNALEPLYERLKAHLALAPHPPPDVLIGDILLALNVRHPVMAKDKTETEDGSTEHCHRMFHGLTRGRRWGYLANRLVNRNRHSSDASVTRNGLLEYLTEMFCLRLMQLAIAPSLSEEAQDAEDSNDMEEDTSSQSAPPVGAPPKPIVELAKDPGALLEFIASKYNERTADHRDKSRVLVDAYTLAMLELGRRASNFDFLDEFADKELLVSCLRSEWDPHTYQPRQLRVVPRFGFDDSFLPGDFLSIRGITKKTREDQIPKVLVSEFAPWVLGERGRKSTLDKLYNRSPVCWENYDTRRPETKHRICLAFVVGVESRNDNHSGASGVNGHVGSATSDGADDGNTRADLLGKTLAFDLLVNAALKVPHDHVEADVVWFERRAGHWLGSGFPLRTLSATRSEDDAWRNVTEVDKVLPHFFVRHVAGVKPSYKHEVAILSGQPTEHLGRALRRGLYQAVFVVAVLPEEEIKRCLPPASLALPRFDQDTPTVLLATVRNGDGVLHWEGFSDLLSAHVALLPLEQTDTQALVRTFLTMIVGAMEQKHVLPTV